MGYQNAWTLKRALLFIFFSFFFHLYETHFTFEATKRLRIEKGEGYPGDEASTRQFLIQVLVPVNQTGAVDLSDLILLLTSINLGNN